MTNKQVVKYGDKTMELPDGMTLAQAKQQMARFFPELADPQVDSKTVGEVTTHTFSKKAGRKGAAPLAALTTRLRKVRATPIAPPVLVAAALQAAEPPANLEHTLAALVRQGNAVIDFRRDVEDLPPTWPPQLSAELLL